MIYKVYINFSYYELKIGFFSSLERAEEIKLKWETFFEENKHLDYPSMYHYRYIYIHELETDKDELMDGMLECLSEGTSQKNKELLNEIKKFNRDYKIRKIID